MTNSLQNSESKVGHAGMHEVEWGAGSDLHESSVGSAAQASKDFRRLSDASDPLGILLEAVWDPLGLGTCCFSGSFVFWLFSRFFGTPA